MTHGSNLGGDGHRDAGAGMPATGAPANLVWYWSGVGATALVCAVTAIVAGALLQLLSLSTPHPATFFRWIAVRVTVAAALVPLALTDIVADAVVTGLLNAVIGISLTTLLPAVAAQSRLRL